MKDYDAIKTKTADVPISPFVGILLFVTAVLLQGLIIYIGWNWGLRVAFVNLPFFPFVASLAAGLLTRLIPTK